MRPVTLRMEGFRHYQAPQTVRFPDGLCAIVGANGAGKSSILQAIEVALFGPDGRSLGPYVTWGHDRMTVELEFEHDGDTYRARRSSQRGKHLLDLEVAADGIGRGAGGTHWDRVDRWGSLSGETVAATQEKIGRLLGFSRTTLRASSLLMQGDASAWVDRDPRDRKQVLADVLGLDTYGRLLDEARQRRRATDTEIAVKHGRLSLLQEQAAPLQELRQRSQTLHDETLAADTSLADRTADLERVAAAVADGERRDRDRQDLARQVETLDAKAVALRKVDLDATVAAEKADAIRTDIARLERLAVELADVVNTLAGLEQLTVARSEALAEKRRLEERYDQAIAEMGRLREQRDAEIAAAEQLERQAAATEAGQIEQCGHCGQPLGLEARAVAAGMSWKAAHERRAATAELDRQLLEARDTAKTHGVEINALTVPDEPEGLAGLRARFVELESVPADLAAARARLEALDHTIAAAGTPEHRDARAQAEAAVTAARDRLADIEPVLGLDDLRRQHTTAAAKVRDATSVREEVRARAAETLALLQVAENAHTEATELAGETGRLQRDAADLAELEQAYGPNGIPLLILENVAVPAIEQHANEILARLALDYRVEIRTQTEKADGGLRDALDVIVTTGHGEAAFEQLSGSEKTRVAVALRVGLARLLAARRGADCRMLALDEPEGLDATVRPMLVDVLRDLEAARVFDQVLLVSHENDLRDAFDQTIQVERGENGWSHIAGAATVDDRAVVGEAA